MKWVIGIGALVLALACFAVAAYIWIRRTLDDVDRIMNDPELLDLKEYEDDTPIL